MNDYDDEYSRAVQAEFQEYLRGIERKLHAIEKLPDDTPILFVYQYKSRDHITEELTSAKEAVEILKNWLKDDLVDINGLEVKVFSEEEARLFKESKEREERAYREEHARKKAEDEHLRRIDLLRVIPHATMELAVDSELDKVKNRGIFAATDFVDTLKESVENPKDYSGKRGAASGMEKLLHEGWKEHNDLKRAFQSADKIESRVSPAMTSKGKKNYNVEVRFTDKEGKEIITISTIFDDDGKESGGISMSMP